MDMAQAKRAGVAPVRPFDCGLLKETKQKFLIFIRKHPSKTGY